MYKHEDYMQQAIELAKRAESLGEVPVGAVVVLNDQVIGEGYNQPISSNDPTAHAEIIALRDAAKKVGNYRLINTILYVTLEPCLMCVGAIIHARVQDLVFGASDSQRGAISTISNLLELPQWNHQLHYQSGVLSEPCADLLRKFFKKRR